MAKAETLAQKISNLAYPTPRDFDPEDEYPVSEDEASESEEEESGDDLAGTEHYVQSGKSKLRKPEQINLGPKYSGSQISRRALFADHQNYSLDVLKNGPNRSSPENFSNSGEEDCNSSLEDESIDSEEVQSDLEEQIPSKVKNTSKYSKEVTSLEGENKLPKNHETDHLDNNYSDISDSSDSDHDRCDSNFSNRNDKEIIKRSEIQRFMEEDQKAILSTLSQAAKVDAEKGRAIKSQQMRFDSLLNTRMELQKALIAVNSLTTFQDDNSIFSKDKPYEAAEEAALKLWNRLFEFRNNLSKPTTTHERARKIITSDQKLSSAMWEKMKILESASIDDRQKIIEKWSIKTRGSMTHPLTEKLNPTITQQNIISFLNDHLENSEQLIRRTKIPRSCAPIQRDLKLVEDPNIYDDGNFYQMLLKELVEQRRSELSSMPVTSTTDNQIKPWTAIKEPKVRKVVDKRASKGRKMRFTVHEKLQNFAAPEDRSSWEQLAVNRLFASLLGQKVVIDECSESDH